MIAGRVMGIDPGLARTGVGELTFDGTRTTSLTTRLVESNPARGLEATVQRMGRMIRRILPTDAEHCDTCGRTANTPPGDLALIVVEEKAQHAHHRDDQTVFLGRLLSVAIGRGHPIALVNPGTLKCWAADHGKATDDMMRTALERLYPGTMAADDDQVDGALLALAGAQFLRWWEGPVPLRQQPHLGRMRWPTMPGATRR